MLARDVVAAIIRIMAIVIAFLGIRSCLVFFATESNIFVWAPVIIVTLSILVFILLWASSYRLSGWLLPRHSQVQSEQLSTSAIESIALCILATYFICQGAADLFYWLSFYFFSVANEVKINQYDINFMASIAASAFMFLLGIVLLVGIKPILKGIRQLRTVGLASNG